MFILLQLGLRRVRIPDPPGAHRRGHRRKRPEGGKREPFYLPRKQHSLSLRNLFLPHSSGWAKATQEVGDSP